MKKDSLGFLGYMRYSFKHNFVFTFEVFSLPYKWLKCIKKNKSIACHPRFTFGGLYEPKTNQDCYRIEVFNETHLKEFCSTRSFISEPLKANPQFKQTISTKVKKHDVVTEFVLEKYKQIA